jgi:hypothetical protein
MQHPTPIASATVSKRCGVSGRRLVMRLLWVKGGKLLPVDTGGKIRSYNILKGLARRHEVVLLSYYPGTPDPEYDAAIVREFPGAVTVALGEIGGAAKRSITRGGSSIRRPIRSRSSPTPPCAPGWKNSSRIHESTWQSPTSCS